MQIKDEDGNIIDEWTSEGKVHYATGLVEGKKYILHEDLAPTGLNLANDIEFEVSYAKENQKVEMIDTINEVSKVDEKGNLLKGVVNIGGNKARTESVVMRGRTGTIRFVNAIHNLDKNEILIDLMKKYNME